MKRALRLFVGLLLLVIFAVAQEEDAVLQSYSLGIENLDAAVAAMPDDIVTSNDKLESALQALRPLAAESSSSALISQLETTFERAKTTIQNQSQADLTVQVAVLKGGFQRLVYEAAVDAANTSDVATTEARLARLAADLGFAPEIQAALTNQTDLNKLFAAFEQGVAQGVKTRLAGVMGQLETDKGAAYRTLAEAYGTFLPVQDSPRADASSNNLFTQSFSALVAGDIETLTQAVSQLDAQMDQLSSAAEGVLGSPSVPVETAPAPEATPAEATPAQPEATAPVETATPETALTETTLPETTVTETTAPTTEALAPILEASGEVVPAAPVNAFAEKLKAELATLGVSPNQQATLSDELLQEGYTSVGGVMDSLLAKTSVATSAVQEGNQTLAKSQLADVQEGYDRFLSSLVSSRSSSLDSTTSSLLSSLESSPSLRQQDVLTLNQQLIEVSKMLDLNPAPASSLQGLSNTVTGFWSGWTRLAVMIVLGLFAFVPLYLLFLAFGGGNRNWQLIGYALFLLLLPVIYEGISFLLSLINSFVNMPVLETLSRFSMFQNPLTQVVWVMLTALAIVLATMGLYGICVQFGLLGRRKEDETATVIESSPSKTSIEAAKTTNFEWDEEF